MFKCISRNLDTLTVIFIPWPQFVGHSILIRIRDHDDPAPCDLVFQEPYFCKGAELESSRLEGKMLSIHSDDLLLDKREF